MNKVILLIVMSITFASCKSTKSVKETKLDINHSKIDNTIKVSKVATIEYSFDEIIITPSDPMQETVIADNKGNTKSFKNVKSISIKKKKESIKQEEIIVKNDLKDVLTDKSIEKESKSSKSDVYQWKWIVLGVAAVFICIVVLKLS
jgi:hypothetical protein